MATGFRKILEGLRLIPKAASTASEKGDLDVTNSSGKLNYHNGTSASPVVTEDHSAVLTNKTIDGDNNTVQDLALGSLKTVLADADKVIRRDAAGIVVSGNALPNSSQIVTLDSSDTLTNKTLTTPVVNTSLTGGAGGSLTVQSASNQNLSLQAQGTGIVQLESLSINANTVTGGAAALVIQSASNQNLSLQAQGTGVVQLESLSVDANTITGSAGSLTIQSTLNMGTGLPSNPYSITFTGIINPPDLYEFTLNETLLNSNLNSLLGPGTNSYAVRFTPPALPEQWYFSPFPGTVDFDNLLYVQSGAGVSNVYVGKLTPALISNPSLIPTSATMVELFETPGGPVVPKFNAVLNTNNIKNVKDPTVAQDAATKNYVDNNTVTSLAKSGDPALKGAVTLSAGSNVTLTQTGQNISIASTGGDFSTVVLRNGSQSMTGNLDMAGNDLVDVQEINFSEPNNSRIYQDNTGFYINTGTPGPLAGMTMSTGPFNINSGSFNVNENGGGGIELKTTGGTLVLEASTGEVRVRPGSPTTRFVVQCAGGAKIDNGLDVNIQRIQNVASPTALGDAVNLLYLNNNTVGSIAKTGNPALRGAVTLAEGTGITLTQAGQQISIAASGGAGVPVGTIVAFSGGYFTGANNTGTWTDVLGNTIATVNSYVASSGFVVCDGTALNDPASPIFNGAGRFLPNLTDSRFLQGSTTSGGVGGQNSFQISTSNLPNLSLTVSGSTSFASNPSTGDVAAAGHNHGVSTYEARIRNAIGSTSLQTRLNDPAAAGSWSATNRNDFAANGVASGTLISTASSIQGVSGGNIGNTTVALSGNLPNHNHTISGTASGTFTNTAIENRPVYFDVFYIMRIK